MPDENPTPKQPESRTALQRVLVLLAIVIGVLIYAYGWSVTEIDLERPQEAQRQENVAIALRELLSPNVFSQERTVEIYSADFLMACDEDTRPQAPASEAAPVVRLNPTCGDNGDVITFSITGAAANADARVRWIPPASDDEETRPRPRELVGADREDFVLSSSGSFTGQIEVPRIRGGEGQIHTVQVQVAVPAGPIQLSESALLVADRMLQTIFMALVATTVAIPIAGVLSFFAARNLMEEITLSVGSLLIAFTTFVVGLWLGGTFLTPLGRMALMIGRGDLGGDFGALTAFAVPGVYLFGMLTVMQRLNPVQIEQRNQEANRLKQTSNSIVVGLSAIVLVGALGGLGLLGGEQIQAGGAALAIADPVGIAQQMQAAASALIVALGNFLTLLGTLVEMGIGLLASVVTAFTLAGIAGNWLGPLVRGVPAGLGRGLGLGLGAVAGAMLLGFLGVLGTWASLLGLLPVLVAAILGGNLLLTIARRVAVATTGADVFKRQRLLRLAVFVAGAVIVFILAFDLLNVGRSLVDGTLPTATQTTLLGSTLPLSQYVFNAMWLGALLGGLGGAISSVKAVFPLGNLLYNTSRTSLNVVRSIEPLIMGLVFVVWVGIGPFAGVLALTLHSVAALGKLYSEQIENIDPGPIEALKSTGANQLQTIVYAVVPQIIPPYIAFTMYRWDINVRMSTIIGFVGGGGIGLLLQQQINLLRYREAGVAVLAIAIVVSILDYASATIRERLT